MIKQYKEVVATEEYIVAVYDNKSIDVYNRYDNAKGALREIADEYGFEYDNDWTTRQFGKKLIDAVGDGAKAIADDTYCVYIDANGSVICGSKYEGSTKDGLRTVANKYKIAYEDSWNTQQFGCKVIEALR